MTDFQITLFGWILVVLFLSGALLSVLRTITDSKVSSNQKRIENVLPGMNCGQCGFPSCSAYAEALAADKAPCNLCHPGGPEICKNIATVLGIQVPVSDDFDSSLFAPRQVAYIHASECNGCDKCLKHCKVDAIEGATKSIHTVNELYCIGCSECVEGCPKKCIEMIRLEPTLKNFDWKIDSKRAASGAR